MLVKRVKVNREDLLDPANEAWRRTQGSKTVLSPIPLAMQPAEYVRVSWEDRPYGAVTSMRVSAFHNGQEIFFRLVWDDATVDKQIADIDQFVDAAAVLFPVVPDAPLIGMGAEGKPVNAWLWRADWEQPKNVVAEGMGTTERREDPALLSKAKHQRGRWEVVISRSLDGKDSPAGTVSLEPGATSKVAFAIWQGSNQERAGIKAFSPAWQELEIEA